MIVDLIYETCPRCNGDGIAPQSSSRECTVCKGTGKTNHVKQVMLDDGELHKFIMGILSSVETRKQMASMGIGL